MALTLTYGRVQPETNDRQAVWMDALEDNVTLDDAHDHDGTDSAFLPATSIKRYTDTILAAAWSGSAGVYTVTKTVPAEISGAATYNDANDYNIMFYITATGVRINPSVQRTASNTYVVTVNDNTLALTVMFK